MSSLQMIVKQHQVRAAQFAPESFDWNKRKAKWLASLRQLIDQLRQWLMDAGVPGEEIIATRHSISEEGLGDYEAPGLEVKIGRLLVTFVPVASNVIGGVGRVDVTGPRGEVKLIADTVQPVVDGEPDPSCDDREWLWLAYPDRSRRGGFPLDENGLAKVLEVVLGDA
ncbi:MAG: hypothetical protein VBE63_20865 [Lamprobacter sp.]|uniref:hypothetical protein n=1 Tax=Lamprobacter sp. TaxID=3100796 RepID=UPI002B25BFB4|nr:hypothetical protein [Lamprobacter sp.]MEA3642371.1 hypothetical protein [Lamprobacter sp.]